MGQFKAKTPMHRIIAGTLYERNPTPYAHDLRVYDLGGGHVEALAVPRYGWSEVAPLAPLALADWEAYTPDFWGKATTPPPLSPAELLERAAADRERSTRRARTKVRRLAKFKLLTDLLTLTYREEVTDRARMQRDFDVFMKRVKRVLPGFEYICVFERQKRGTWHAHIAVRRFASHYLHKGALVKSYDLLRSMWRGVVGADNGNIDVSRGRAVRRSTAKLAAYLSKYIGKSFGDNEKHANSYSASGRTIPDAVLERVASPLLADAIAALVDLIRPEATAGGAKWSHCMLDSGGWFLCVSPPDRGKPA